MIWSWLGSWAWGKFGRRALVTVAAGTVAVLLLVAVVFAGTFLTIGVQDGAAAQTGSTAMCGPTGAGAGTAVAAARWAGFSVTELPMAVAIAKAESGWNPDAMHVNTNGSTDFGMWQINSIHAGLLAKHDWRDPYQNAAMAYQIWVDAGGSWTPWSTFNSGSYVQFLPAARAAVAGSSPCEPAPPSGTGVHTQSDLILLGQWFVARGFDPGEGPPPFGPINRVHTSGSYHYRTGPTGIEGLALDVNWRGAGSELSAFDGIVDGLVAQGWRVIWRTTGHFDHMHIDTGPAGRVWL